MKLGKPLSDREVHDMFDEMLNECHGTVTIAGLECGTAQALKKVDPVAYRCAFADYWSSLLDDGYAEDENGDLCPIESEEE